MDLDKDEHVLKVIRKHPFYIIILGITLFLLAVFPAILPYLINLLLNSFGDLLALEIEVNLIQIQGFLYNLWLLTLWLIFMYRFTDYYLDKWVITDKRIIDIDQRGFFVREVSSVRYPQIQDATSEIVGLIPTIFNFGTLVIQSAGTEQEFKLTLTPNPLKVKEFIIDQKYAHQPSSI